MFVQFVLIFKEDQWEIWYRLGFLPSALCPLSQRSSYPSFLGDGGWESWGVWGSASLDIFTASLQTFLFPSWEAPPLPLPHPLPP